MCVCAQKFRDLTNLCEAMDIYPSAGNIVMRIEHNKSL